MAFWEIRLFTFTWRHAIAFKGSDACKDEGFWMCLSGHQEKKNICQPWGGHIFKWDAKAWEGCSYWCGTNIYQEGDWVRLTEAFDRKSLLFRWRHLRQINLPDNFFTLFWGAVRGRVGVWNALRWDFSLVSSGVNEPPLNTLILLVTQKWNKEMGYQLAIRPSVASSPDGHTTEWQMLLRH